VGLLAGSSLLKLGSTLQLSDFAQPLALIHSPWHWITSIALLFVWGSFVAGRTYDQTQDIRRFITLLEFSLDDVEKGRIASNSFGEDGEPGEDG
jgi:hypothetical protein